MTTYIIPAGVLAAVKAKLQAGADREENPLPGVLGMFTTPLSPSGKGKATHYCSSGQMSDEEMDYLEAELPSLQTFKGTHEVTDAEGNVSQVEWTAWAAFESLNLQIVQAEP